MDKDKKPYPTFFSNMSEEEIEELSNPLTKGRKKMPTTQVTLAMVKEAYDKTDDFQELVKLVREACGNEKYKAGNIQKHIDAIELEIFKSGQTPKKLKNVSAPTSTSAKPEATFAYWGTKGIFIPNNLIKGLELDIQQDEFKSIEGQGNVQLEPTKYGTCFAVGKDKTGTIVLKPDNSFDDEHKKAVDDAWIKRKAAAAEKAADEKIIEE